MRSPLLWIGIVLCLGGCRPVKYSATPDHGDYLRTDSSMIQHENPSNKSSTGVGIPGY
jgi:hypothetical protein